MRENGSGMPKWENKVGPASLLAFAQLAVLIAGGIYGYAKLENTADNTKNTASILQSIVAKQRERTEDINNRLIRVETNVEYVSKSVSQILQKIDGTKP